MRSERSQGGASMMGSMAVTVVGGGGEDIGLICFTKALNF